MTALASKSGLHSADPSLISPEFVQRLQEQRALHKREVTFHLAEAEKHGEADEALASMIEAAEKIVAIMGPAPTKAADAHREAKTVDAPREAKTADAPREAKTEVVNPGPSWTEPTLAVVAKAAEPTARNEAPMTSELEDDSSDEQTESRGNVWRTRLLRSGT
jgi:hypothetical protein